MMKKFAFALILVCLMITVQAQELLGYSMAEVEQHHSQINSTAAPVYEVNRTGNPMLVFHSSEGEPLSVVYYFNADRCYTVAYFGANKYRSNLIKHFIALGFYYEDGYWYNEITSEVAQFKEGDKYCSFEIWYWGTETE
ncbi:MAG: hypothetical protein LPK21_16750 [Hymenobacteraceae bacterium]|nr:hypothetical protein [Hymenobacteraceae bacterium]